MIQTRYIIAAFGFSFLHVMLKAVVQKLRVRRMYADLEKWLADTRQGER